MTSKSADGRSRATSLLLGLIGISALGLTILINYWFGATLALDAEAQYIQGASSVVVDCMAVAMALALGIMLRQRDWLPAVVTGAFLLSCMAYSTASVVGFGATQRYAKAEKIERQTQAQAQAVSQANDIAMESRREAMEWLKQTAVQAQGRTERLKLSESVVALANTPIAIKAPPAVTEIADPQAVVIAKLASRADISATSEDIQIGLVVALAALLVFGKGACFAMASYLWPVRQSVAKETAKEASPAAHRLVFPKDTYSPVVFDGRPALPEYARDRRHPRLAYDSGHAVDFSADEAAADAALTESLLSDAEKIKKLHEHVESFFANCTYSKEGSMLKASQVYESYVAWTQLCGLETLTQNRFGRVCTALKIRRDESIRGSSVYVDIALVSGGVEAAEPVAA